MLHTYAHVVNLTLCNAAIRNTKDAKKRSPDKEEDAMVSKPKAKHCQKLDFHAILILLGEIVLGAPMVKNQLIFNSKIQTFNFRWSAM